MHRNYGLSPRRVGAEHTPGAPIAHGALRESSIQECAAAFFCAAFASVPVVAVWFLSALIDWDGVGEVIGRLFDFG